MAIGCDKINRCSEVLLREKSCKGLRFSAPNAHRSLCRSTHYKSWESTDLKRIMAGKIFINFVLEMLGKIVEIRHSTQHVYLGFPSALILSSAFILYPNSFPLSETNSGISEIPLSQSLALCRLQYSSPSRKNTWAKYPFCPMQACYVAFYRCVFVGTHAHTSTYPTLPVSGSHKRPQHSDEFEPLFEQLSGSVTFPVQLHSPSARASSCGAQGGPGGLLGLGKVLWRFWVAYGKR